MRTLSNASSVWKGYRLAVEFRHQMWFSDGGCEKTLAFHRKHGIAHVIVDEPQRSKSSIPAVWEVTCPEVVVVRLHGRNHGTWDKKGLKAASERFDYWYDKAELKTLLRISRR